MYLKIVWVIFSTVLIGCSQNDSLKIENKTQLDDEFSVPIYNEPDFTPYWNQEELDTFHTISSFNFINQFNENVSSETVKNKIYVVNFFFTTCNGICPKMMKNMEKLAQHFENDSNVIFISHTVTPWIDDVKKLEDYSSLYDVKKINGIWLRVINLKFIN